MESLSIFIDTNIMNYKKLRDWNSGFVRWVLRRHPNSPKQQNGFMGGFIFGERGEGKSTYCYKAMAKTHYELRGYVSTDNEEDAYKEALEYMIYEPTAFQTLINYNRIKRIVTPIVCLDDASMHFGKYLFHTQPKLCAALLADTATVRTAITGFLVNAPKRSHVVKFLREYDDFKGEVKVDQHGGNTNMPGWNRKVRFYRWNYYPDEVKYRIQIPFQDKYSCYIPDEFYNWYLDKKRFFELKHGIEVADKLVPGNRQLFIAHKDELPYDLKQIVEKWEKEDN